MCNRSSASCRSKPDLSRGGPNNLQHRSGTKWTINRRMIRNDKIWKWSIWLRACKGRREPVPSTRSRRSCSLRWRLRSSSVRLMWQSTLTTLSTSSISWTVILKDWSNSQRSSLQWLLTTWSTFFSSRMRWTSTMKLSGSRSTKPWHKSWVLSARRPH